MANDNRSVRQNLEKMRRQREIRRRRQRIQRMRAAVLACLIIGVIAVIASCNREPKKENAKAVEKVKLMTYDSEPEQSIENEHFVYTEPTECPARHENGERFDRLATAKENPRKVCYLTFDDGPNNSITPQVLDVLRRYDVKATFFMVGTLIESNSDMARRVYEEGHLLANHSYSHNYKNIYASTESFMTEIEKTEDLIKDVLDSEDEYFPLVRFPGGSYNAGSYKEVKQTIKERLNEESFYYCDWNSLNGDAEGAKKDADGLFEYFKKNTNTEKTAVVLMHDTVTKQATVDCLPRLIEYMRSKGYVFLRLDEEAAPENEEGMEEQEESTEEI